MWIGFLNRPAALRIRLTRPIVHLGGSDYIPGPDCSVSSCDLSFFTRGYLVLST